MDDTSLAVAALFGALDLLGRARTRGDQARIAAGEREVDQALRHVVSVVGRPLRVRIDAAPPRPVAVAMAQAMFSLPHLARTLSVDTTISDLPVVSVGPGLSEALGLPLWELEEIRGDVDLRVADAFKQLRTLNWLWARFPNPRLRPDALFHTLFPGNVGPQASHFARRGGRLYAVVPQDAPPPPESLYLRWLPGSTQWTCLPDSHFDARYVDAGLIRALERAVGADPEEARRILDNLVCTIPRREEESFVAQDRWRSEGWAALTRLGAAWPGSEWLTLPLAADAIAPEGWIERTDKGLSLRSPRRVFDRHAMTRVTALVHGLYAEICARALSREAPGPGDLAVLFDLSPYVQRALQPMLDWTASSATHAALARTLGVEPSHVGAALAQVRGLWLQAAGQSWGGVPREDRPYTVQTLLAAHLALTHASLTRVLERPPDPRAAHTKVALLFFAHYHQDAPLGRLWRVEDGVLPPPEDVMGEWFWGTWQRVLQVAQED